MTRREDEQTRKVPRLQNRIQKYKKIYPEYRTQENRKEQDSILKIEEENTNQTDLGTQSSDAN